MMLLLVCALAAGMVQDTTIPRRRAHHSWAYDHANRRIILSGGSTPIDDRRGEWLNDLWAFDSSGWHRLGGGGPGISGSTLAFDRTRNRLVAFGGHDGRSLPDLRVLEGTVWRTIGRHPTTGVAEPGFVYDVRRNRFIAFGGSSGPGQGLGDTWILTGDQWERSPVAPAPQARQGHAMVYDERRDRVVLFGGVGSAPRGQPPPFLNDTWEFDGSIWIRHEAPGATPAARSGAGMAYDSRRGLTILFGGDTPEGFLGDTWSWDGHAWRRLSESGPEPRGMGYLAYDAHRDRVVLFGGRKGWPDGDLNDTWEWDGTTWRQDGH